MASEEGTGMLGDAVGWRGPHTQGSLPTDQSVGTVILAFVPKEMWVTVLFVSVFCESLAG